LTFLAFQFKAIGAFFERQGGMTNGATFFVVQEGDKNRMRRVKTEKKLEAESRERNRQRVDRETCTCSNLKMQNAMCQSWLVFV